MIKRVVRSDLVAILIALFITSPFIYWGIDRSDPVTVHEFTISPEHVKPGGKMLRQVTVTRNRACLTDVDAVIIDGARVRWVIDEPEITRPGTVGVKDSYNAPMIVPPLAAPGPAELRLVVRRECNPLHRIWPIITTYETKHFTILPP